MPVIKRILRELSGERGTDRPELSTSRVSIDPNSLMKLKNLELRAKVVVQGFMAGIHRSPYHGFSVEFTDYRQYSPGDDIRHVDWKLFARQDRYYIKRFEDETNLRCYLLADMSRSMSYGSGQHTKMEYARTALATLAYYLSLQRDAVGLLTFDEDIGDFLPPRYRPGQLRRLMLSLERSTAGSRTDLAPPLERIARTANKRGLIVLVSDLLAPVDDLRRNLGFLRSQGHDVIVMRILDPAELSFEFNEPKIFEDMETGRDLFVDPPAIRNSYLNRFAEHAAALKEVCQQLGVDLSTLSTDMPLDRVLFEFFTARSRRGKWTRHVRSAPFSSTTSGEAP